MEEINGEPSEQIGILATKAGHLLESICGFGTVLDKQTRGSELIKSPSNSTKALNDVKKEGDKESRVKALSVQLMKKQGELELTLAKLKKAEDTAKEKERINEELEENVNKLTRRLQTSPLTPYALTVRKYLDPSAPSHECVCIICGDTCKAQSTPSVGDSPEVLM